MLLGETSPCERCGWWNATLRKRCRNCLASLVFHPDPEIDREVRLDYAAARRPEIFDDPREAPYDID